MSKVNFAKHPEIPLGYIVTDSAAGGSLVFAAGLVLLPTQGSADETAERAALLWRMYEARVPSAESGVAQ